MGTDERLWTLLFASETSLLAQRCSLMSVTLLRGLCLCSFRVCVFPVLPGPEDWIRMHFQHQGVFKGMLLLESGGKFCAECDKFRVQAQRFDMAWPPFNYLLSLAFLAHCTALYGGDFKRILACVFAALTLLGIPLMFVLSVEIIDWTERGTAVSSEYWPSFQMAISYFSTFWLPLNLNPLWLLCIYTKAALLVFQY